MVRDLLDWIYDFRRWLRLAIKFLRRARTKLNYGKRHRGKRLFDEERNSIVRVSENLVREAWQNWI